MTLLLLLLSCVHPVPVGSAVVSGHLPPGHIIIAHTNDIHAHYLPEPASWLPDQPSLGGFVALDAWVRSLEEADGPDAVLFLDAGDQLTGTPLMELEERGVHGGAMATLTALVGVDGWVLGNHEFDRGFGAISAYVAADAVPAMSANLRAPCPATDPMDCPEAVPGTQPWKIYTVNGLKVGVFGLTTAGLESLANAQTMSHLRVVSHADAAREMVAVLEPQVDLVVALTHIGIEDDEELAREVPGIDLIVGGHSHTRMDRPEHIGDSWIVQAGCYGRLLGIADLTVADGRITDLQWRAQALDPAHLPLPPRPEVQTLVDSYKARVDQRFSESLGAIATTLTRDHDAESPLGRWAADVVREAAEADVGVYNAGGLRADLRAGPLTVGSLYEVFPFGNRVVRFELSGADLATIMLSTAEAELHHDKGVLQWSGVCFTWRQVLDVPQLVHVQIGAEPLDPDRRYTLATNSFVAAQWRRNLGGIQPREVVDAGMTVLQAAIARARSQAVSPPTDQRDQPIADTSMSRAKGG